jgi:hypothetical protein
VDRDAFANKKREIGLVNNLKALLLMSKRRKIFRLQFEMEESQVLQFLSSARRQKLFRLGLDLKGKKEIGSNQGNLDTQIHSPRHRAPGRRPLDETANCNFMRSASVAAGMMQLTVSPISLINWDIH